MTINFISGAGNILEIMRMENGKLLVKKITPVMINNNENK
jgi:hypothetical protein